ncbi:uncharacterized protein LOC112508030 isoform X2 [Cynara cardunculus var. scolymus]|uniref:uncharacterized protein LOC112508030 isoform X2 n=1 Tax=Cynara cardunculus var. scolymus TaxID=59895 RepID=UPI000D624590|nr:uncharacterized protein LOC112508030 isoform X2 [Cynara cardunculus var. scolymus]
MTESSISSSMAFDIKENEALIPSNQTHQRHHMDSGSESAFIGSWGSSSSSSFLTTSFGSELDSNDADLDDGGEEDEFIAQLTRQMADYMLEENDDSGGDENPPSKPSVVQKRNFQEPNYNQNHEQTRRSYADTVKKSIVGFQSDQNFTVDKQKESPIQVENQPRVGGQSGGGWGRKGKMTESTQQMKSHQMHNNRGLLNGGKAYSGGVHGSSGMRAIFLGGSGSRSVMSGTGVFLPRSATDATDHSRKKPGCSTALVPTRVLQALEQHFNNLECLSPLNTLPQTQVKNDGKQAQESVPVDHPKSKLPQEWIY